MMEKIKNDMTHSAYSDAIRRQNAAMREALGLDELSPPETKPEKSKKQKKPAK
jgi:hypothetical protein